MIYKLGSRFQFVNYNLQTGAGLADARRACVPRRIGVVERATQPRWRLEPPRPRPPPWRCRRHLNATRTQGIDPAAADLDRDILGRPCSTTDLDRDHAARHSASPRGYRWRWSATPLV